MHDAVVVGGLQGASDALEDDDGLGEGERRTGPVAQTHPVDQLHDEVVPAILEPSEGEDVDDVGMSDLVGRPRLGQEPRHMLGPCCVGCR